LGEGGGGFRAQGIFQFWGRDVGAITHATFFLKELSRIVGRDAVRLLLYPYYKIYKEK